MTNHVRESLPHDALAMTLAASFRAGEEMPGIVHHGDRGVQHRVLRIRNAIADSEVVSIGGGGETIRAMAR